MSIYDEQGTRPYCIVGLLLYTVAWLLCPYSYFLQMHVSLSYDHAPVIHFFGFWRVLLFFKYHDLYDAVGIPNALELVKSRL